MARESDPVLAALEALREPEPDDAGQPGDSDSDAYVAWQAANDMLDAVIEAAIRSRPGITTLGEQNAWQAGFDAGRADALAPSMELEARPASPEHEHNVNCDGHFCG